MMPSCLLCLNTIKNKLDFIESNSKRWQELSVADKLERHFWSLSIIQSNSGICLSCWHNVDEFHKFYSNIEEIHMNFYKIKVEDDVECKEELKSQVSLVTYNTEECSKTKMAYCFLEPEILIDQIHTHNVPQSDVAETLINNTMGELNVHKNGIFEDSCKRQKFQNDLTTKDPLMKSCVDMTGKGKRSKEEKQSVDFKSIAMKVKEEPKGLNDNDSDSTSDNDNEESDDNYVPQRDSSGNEKMNARKSNGKHRTKRAENDKFIAEHFKEMFCDLCQIILKDFSVMKKHFLVTHQQQGYFVCCKRKYFSRRLLIDHIHSHLNPDHFKCNQCGKVMSDRLRLEKHIMWIHSSEEAVKKHCCDECGKSFADAQYLRMHKLTHLSEEEKKFPCEECGKFYGSSNLLHRHIQAVHLKKFVKICHICGKFISCSTDYKIHMNKHEGIPQPNINCDVCGLRLTTERGLKIHKDTQHPVDGKKEHHCPKCPKISPTLKALRKHINTMHVKGYDHKCTICEKVFKRAEVLREHVASHTGNPLYKCPWCPKTFNSNSNMHAHRKKIHPKEWEEAKLQKYSVNLKPNIANVN